jgi:hypothetical protein
MSAYTQLNFGQMRAAIASYMQRSLASFSQTHEDGTTVDLLSLVINAARKNAELTRNFELNRVQAQLIVDLQNGAHIDNMTLLDGVTAVRCKSVAKAFLPIADSNGDGYFPIDVMNREKHLERVARFYSQTTQLGDVTQRYTHRVPYFAIVRIGDVLYLTPNDATRLNNADPITVRFDIYQWLPDYTVAADTDFLIQHCWNWMLLRSVYQLNFFLKDDLRIPLSDKVMEREWQTIVAWDSNLVVANSTDADLD